MTDGRRLPVTIISGYLGSGKTTLVNRLLAGAHGRKLAILVNDFGEIAIDEELIVNREGETVALANGCVCCSIGGDLYDAIDRIIRGPSPYDHLILETSGVADPHKVQQIALAEPDLDAFGIITLIDTVNFEASLAEPMLGDTVRRQVEAAGLVVLTKSDLGDAARIARTDALAREIAPHTPFLAAEKGNVPHDLALSRLRGAGGPYFAAAESGHGHEGHDHSHEHDHAALFKSWSYFGPATISATALEDFTRASDLGIYRLKGLVRVSDGAMIEVHRVGDIVRLEPTAAEGETRLVAIGPATRFSPERMQARWLAATG